jgi:hypothetical protein
MQIRKADLMLRLDERSRARYGRGLSEHWYDDLVKDGLVDKLERGPNEGRSPAYCATRHHYRRALQIKRLTVSGIETRDAQLIQLFVRGYGIEPWNIRDALRREYVSFIETLMPNLRSGYLRNSREIGTGHKSSISKKMGPLDARFELANLRQPMDFYIELIRKSLGPGSAGDSDFFQSILVLEPDSKKLSDEMEAALNMPDIKFLEAKIAFNFTNTHVFRPLLGNSLINSPPFVTFVLMFFLTLSYRGFTSSEFLDNLPNPEGFAGIAKDFANAVNSQRRD